MPKAIMIQGAGSNVGKSLLVAGLARAFAARGLRVAPFKAQNISNNAAVTVDGGEIGRAQALQARAANRPAVTDMNPVLIKPEAGAGAQIIVQGKRALALGGEGEGPAHPRPDLMRPVLESFRRLAKTADLVLIEGAGSPAETNLRAGDIANMGFAEAADVPAILVGDIERGGVIAQLVGTQAVLHPRDARRIKAFIINKFHGDTRLFQDGEAEIVRRTGWASLGVVPWFDEAWRLPAEDIVDIEAASAKGASIRVVVPRLDGISNFDDLDPLAAEPAVSVEVIGKGRPLPLDADLIILPGSKSTIADLAQLRAQGWDIDLAAHIRRGGHVLGICGGYQMLGTYIDDPEGLEGAPGRVPGLGHLDVSTVMHPRKHLSLTSAIFRASGEAIEGYEIHLGETTGPDSARAWLQIGARCEGAASPSGRVRGCYLHGLFGSDAFRARMLKDMGAVSEVSYDARVEATLDALAAHLEGHMNLDGLLSLAGEVNKP